MKVVGLSFDVGTFSAGLLVAAVAFGWSPWWLLAALVVIDWRHPLIPDATLIYKSGEGWKFKWRGFGVR